MFHSIAWSLLHFLLAQQHFDTQLAPLIGNVVTAAVLAWYVIYDVRVRTPNMLVAFAKEQTELRVTFSSEQSKERELNRTIVEDIRKTFVGEQTATREAFAADAAARREAHDRETDKLRQLLLDNLMQMRKAVHDVKDTAQTLINKTSTVTSNE